METLDKRLMIPLYFQLARLLREQISSGELAAGAQVPSERELMERYSLSRNTVRQALDMLVREGLVARDHGRGTYVSKISSSYHYMLDTFYENRDLLRRAGFTPTVQHLSTEKVIAPELARIALRLEKGDEVVRHEMVFFADGRPAMYTLNFLPTSYSGGFDLSSGKEGFLQYLDRASGVKVEHILVDISPVEAVTEIAAVFQCPTGSPVLLFQETFMDETQTIPIGLGLNYFNREVLSFRLFARRG